MAKTTEKVRLDPQDPLQATRRLRSAVEIVAGEMEAELVRSISHPYPPSAGPGEVPHLRTGTLLRSVEVVPDGFSVKVNSVDYGGYLERGQIPDGQPRPWVAPIINDRAEYWSGRIVQVASELE